MSAFGAWRYRISRTLGRLVTRTCAMLTFGRMPPFVSASALVVEGDTLLVVIDPLRREPILPGGHLAWRETPESAVIREVREETGMEIRIVDLVGVVAGEELAGESGVVRIVYHARATGGAIASSSEGQALWMPLSQAVSTATRDAPIIRGWLEQQKPGRAASIR